jgi:hypothetical protein
LPRDALLEKKEGLRSVAAPLSPSPTIPVISPAAGVAPIPKRVSTVGEIGTFRLIECALQAGNQRCVLMRETNGYAQPLR